MRIRPEVARAVVLFEPRQTKARPFLRRIEFHDEEAFIVAKRDVVARPIFLDQLALEQDRFGFARHGVRLEIPDRLEQRARFEIGHRHLRGHEIGADPFAQIARLAHVNDAAEPVPHQVDAGLVRHFVHFLVQVWLFFRQRHGHGRVRENV